MNNIEWKENAVCYANGEQWQVTLDDRIQGDVMNAHCSNFALLLHTNDFQLNEIREGDFIPASELDTEQKYISATFKLFGFVEDDAYKIENSDDEFYAACDIQGKKYLCGSSKFLCEGRQLTYFQIIAIGKLKRMMLEREKKDKANRFMEATIKDASDYTRIAKSIFPSALVKFTPNYDVNPFTKYGAIKYNPSTMKIKGDGSVIAKQKRRNKSKQAYDILKDLDYEYDLVKQKWYRKEWI